MEIDLRTWLPEPTDGTPVTEVQGLVYWKGHWIPELALPELESKETNGWLDGAA